MKGLIVWLAYLCLFSVAIGLAVNVPKQLPQTAPPANLPVQYVLEI